MTDLVPRRLRRHRPDLNRPLWSYQVAHSTSLYVLCLMQVAFLLLAAVASSC
jgi:hypothetical protein